MYCMNDFKISDERLEPFIYNETAAEHLHRYAIACQFSANKNILDIACGEGYGSFLISKNAASVIGVDIDCNVIAQASKKYIKKNLSFIQGTTSNIPVADNSIDVVVSFETIEHHNEHEKMFEEIKRVLKSNGVLIISSPEKKYYSDIPNHQNIFHIKELYLDEFKALVSKYFKCADYYFQSYVQGSIIFPETHNPQHLNVFSGDFKCVQKDKLTGMYNICLASDLEVHLPGIEFFDDKYIHEVQMKQSADKHNEQIKKMAIFYKTSWSYRIGHFITAPYRLFKHLVS